MKAFTIVSILALAICANAAKYYGLAEDGSDKDMFLRVIECAQQAVVKGIPEIGLPTHDPLKISRNFSKELALGDYSLKFTMENMYMEGIPWWEVTQMDDITEVKNNPVFDYTIYWKMMSFGGVWGAALVESETGNSLFSDGGDFRLELDHLTFSGVFNFSKPESDSEPGFNDLTLHLHTKESKVEIEGLGVLSSMIKLMGGGPLTELVNLDLLASKAGPGIRDKLNKDWIKKPERIEALITHCV